MKHLILALVTLFSIFALAQEEMTEERKRLIEARKQLSQEDATAVAAFSAGMLNAFGPPISMLSYEGHIIPDNGHGNKQMENRFSLTAPIYRDETQSFTASFNGGKVDFAGPLTLDSGQMVAGEWTRAEVGLAYSRQYESRKNWSVRASVGYNGDDPAHYTKDDSYSFIGTYGFPGNGTDMWQLFVIGANNSQIANYVPIPGFLYIHRTEHFTGAFGLPVLSMQWTPTKQWLFSTSLFGVNVQAEAAYGSLLGLQGFLGYAFTAQSYIPSIRKDDTDRLYMREQRVGPGLRTVFSKKFFVEGQMGWAYRRSIYISSSVFDTDGPYAKLDDGWFGNLALKYIF